MAEAIPVFAGSPAPTTSQIRAIGVAALRYGLALLLVLIGSYKFFAFEAEGIRPLVGSSPLLAWLYGVLSVRGAAAVFGLFEIIVGLLISTRLWMPRVSGYASLVASTMFLVTLSFLVTTPGAVMPTNPFHQFLLKDVVLFGAALCTAAEALSAAHTTKRPMQANHGEP
jgi:reactive chlorine resistance protein C